MVIITSEEEIYEYIKQHFEGDELMGTFMGVLELLFQSRGGNDGVMSYLKRTKKAIEESKIR